MVEVFKICNRLRKQATKIANLKDTLRFTVKRFDNLGKTHCEIDAVLEDD